MSENTIISENVSRTLGQNAQRSNILAAKLIAEIVKTTLGPKGMDKMLVDSANNITVTNDGITILEEIEIDHPAAKMMIEIAKTQETEVGDGTTTVTILAGKLLENAEKLLDKKIHPTTIIKGYRAASEKALEILKELAFPIGNRELLKQIASTAMTGKEAEGSKEHLAELIVSAVDKISEGQEINLNDISTATIVGEEIKKSELIHGVILEKNRANLNMPKVIRNAKILLLDIALEIRNPETETRISVSTPEQLDAFLQSEENYLKELTNKIIQSGANTIFCQKGIDDVAQYYLAKNNIFAVRRVPQSKLTEISRATSAKIISNLNDISESQLGNSETVEEIQKRDNSIIYIRGCKNPRTITLLLKGSTLHVAEEIERAVKDGIGDVVASIKSSGIVPGGGAIEIELSKRLKTFAKTLGGREQLAIESFADSLETIPETLAENAGLDPIDILTELRKQHESGMQNHGLNLFNNQIEDTFSCGIIEPLKIKTQAITSATEFANMILRIDDVLISSKQPKEIKQKEID